jgi:hypothetical protein
VGLARAGGGAREGTGAAVSGADGRRQRGRGQSRGAEQAPEEEEEGRGPRDLLGIGKNLRDLTIN